MTGAFFSIARRSAEATSGAPSIVEKTEVGGRLWAVGVMGDGANPSAARAAHRSGRRRPIVAGEDFTLVSVAS